jgi:glycosyltransferase involved in cell wall biosynthesis
VADAFRPCLVVPVYNHGLALPRTIAALSSANLHCIVVDDGSDSACAAVIDGVAAAHSWIEVIRLPRNRGKGAAMKVALVHSARAGFTHALQIDADNQHDASDVPAFLAAARGDSYAVVIGTARFDASVPPVRRSARQLTQFWVHVNTLSNDIEDAMCGFRVYPLAETVAALDRYRLGDRMDFDIEILVKLHWSGLRFRCIPTRVRYPVDGVSHFRMLRDNALISRMHARCFFGMLLRAPRFVARRMRSAADTR